MDHILFIYSSVNGHFGFIHLLVIENHAAVNVDLQVLLWTYVSFLLGIYLKMELLVHMVTSHLNILRNCLCHFTFPLVVYESSYFSKSLLTLVII